MMCSINPSLDHWGTLATVHPSSVPCSCVLVPATASVMTLMTCSFGLTSLHSHLAKYGSLWVLHYLASIVSYWSYVFDLWVHMSSYLMICVQQVKTLPVSHTLHNLHHHASTLLCRCVLSLNMPIRLAILIFFPVLERNLGFLWAYMHSKVSWLRSMLGRKIAYLCIFCSHLIQLRIPPLLIWLPSLFIWCIVLPCRCITQII